MYESEFDELLTDALTSAFGDNYQEYLLMRYLVINKIRTKDKFKLYNFSRFIADFISANVTSDIFKYKDTDFNISARSGQSLENIIINWDLFSTFRATYSKTKMANIFLSAKKIIKSCSAKARPKGTTALQKKYLYIHTALEAINTKYDVIPAKIVIADVELEENEFTSRSLEEVCEIYLKDLLFDTNDNSLVLEKEIEEWLMFELQSKLADYRFTRQFKVNENCIVDIYGRPTRMLDPTLIFEVKNKKDDRLYWQIIKYHEAIKSAHIVAVCPDYDELLLCKLKSLNYVTVLKFKANIELGKIINLECKIL